MATFVKPPVLETNVPRFLFERHMKIYIKKFIAWSIAEYLSAINYYREVDPRAAKVIEKRFTNRSVAASRPEFKKIVSLMTAEIWNSLSRPEQRFLTEAYQVSKEQRVA